MSRFCQRDRVLPYDTAVTLWYDHEYKAQSKCSQNLALTITPEHRETTHFLFRNCGSAKVAKNSICFLHDHYSPFHPATIYHVPTVRVRRDGDVQG